MSVFRNVVLLAATAGLLAGLVMAAMQISLTAPLISKAEVFETAAGHSAAGHAAQHHGAAVAANAAAGHSVQASDEQAWTPADGLQRSAYTVLANVVTAIGFALILIVSSELAGGLINWRDGLIWGFAGFAVFTLAPGLGLPPELPAMPVAELAARQSWWVASAVATASGLALIVFARNWLLAALGVALLIAPHIIGAPQPLHHGSPIPEDLHHQFVVVATVTSLLFWLVLGAAAGALRNRVMDEQRVNGRSMAV